MALRMAMMQHASAGSGFGMILSYSLKWDSITLFNSNWYI